MLTTVNIVTDLFFMNDFVVKASEIYKKSYFLRLEKSRICLWKFITPQLDH